MLRIVLFFRIENQNTVTLLGDAQKLVEIILGNEGITHITILQHQGDAIRAGLKVDIEGNRVSVGIRLAFKAATGQSGIDVRTQVALATGRIPTRWLLWSP